MRVCTPHCGLDPEARLGGEVYEREVLRALADRGMVLDILLARHKRVPEGVPNWTVHRLPIGRGLRWPVAALRRLSALVRAIFLAKPVCALALPLTLRRALRRVIGRVGTDVGYGPCAS